MPYKANIQQNTVSILAPDGVALLGYRRGDIVEWPMPGGKIRRLKIQDILYQPEAAGDYHR